ncbi:MAG: response regulator transcription factor [Eubacteriales bacterium]|nr:response regulator transcription factor [Eubacteriales bacterium]
MGQKILIADDDYLLRDLLRDILEKEAYEVIEAEDGNQALECFAAHPDLDLILLDIMMPGKGGVEVLKEIRRTSEIPVIMLTALGDTVNELKGFESGASDYVAKPFHGRVLLARIRAALAFKSKAAETEKWKIQDLEIDLDGHRVLVRGKEAVLTNKEYQLLLYLMENRNIVLTRDQILERIWGFDYEGDIRTIDTHIKMLRTDLGHCGSYIRTVRGTGYVFQPEEPA